VATRSVAVRELRQSLSEPEGPKGWPSRSARCNERPFPDHGPNPLSNSLISRRAFPVHRLRELLRQSIENTYSSKVIESLLGRKSRQFPVFFPVRREPRAETGSLETAPSSKESAANLSSRGGQAETPCEGRGDNARPHLMSVFRSGRASVHHAATTPASLNQSSNANGMSAAVKLLSSSARAALSARVRGRSTRRGE
jgi:hypothetical protein